MASLPLRGPHCSHQPPHTSPLAYLHTHRPAGATSEQLREQLTLHVLPHWYPIYDSGHAATEGKSQTRIDALGRELQHEVEYDCGFPLGFFDVV